MLENEPVMTTAISNYDVLFSYGLRMGLPDCTIPSAGREWIATVPVVAQVTPNLLYLMPEDVIVVAGVNLKASRETPFGEYVLSEMGKHSSAQAYCRLSLAECHRENGDSNLEVSELRSALSLGRVLENIGVIMRSEIALARLEPRDILQVLRKYEEVRESLCILDRIAADYDLWLTTHDPEFLRRAWSEQEGIRQDLPEELADTFISGVPLHARIARDWSNQS